MKIYKSYVVANIMSKLPVKDIPYNTKHLWQELSVGKKTLANGHNTLLARKNIGESDKHLNTASAAK